MSNVILPWNTPVRCRAIVDPIRIGARWGWRVAVKGEPPHCARRIYEIEAATDTLAAQDGMRRFMREFEGRCHWSLG
jgi:hypothetical protein